MLKLGRLELKGFIAWLFWCVVHIFFLIDARNRFVVAFTWLWDYITFQRGTRLITGVSGRRPDVTIGGEAAGASCPSGNDRFKGAA